jgi:16S rRNA G527 N7-methylase RsmG
MVVAIAAPSLSVTLVEVRRSRAAFWSSPPSSRVANVTVAARRVEDLTSDADLCFARAFAPLPEAWTAAARLLGPRGRLVYFAGSGAHGRFGVEGARILEVREAPQLESAGPLVIMAR